MNLVIMAMMVVVTTIMVAVVTMMMLIVGWVFSHRRSTFFLKMIA
jgi:hypothetical protein